MLLKKKLRNCPKFRGFLTSLISLADYCFFNFGFVAVLVSNYKVLSCRLHFSYLILSKLFLKLKVFHDECVLGCWLKNKNFLSCWVGLKAGDNLPMERIRTFLRS